MTPMQEQMRLAKERYPGMVLLFDWRGSVWAYGDDAEAVKQAGGDAVGFAPADGKVPAVANVGYRDRERVLDALLRAGRRVALLEEVQR